MTEPFLARLREFGWSEGQNVTLDWRYAEGRPGRLPALAADLVQSNVAVIVAGLGTTRAAMEATERVPIVMTFGITASEAALVGSLARPRGNVTGLTGDVTTEVMSKRLELLREVAPRARRVAALQGSLPDGALSDIRRRRPDALFCGGDPLTMRLISRIVDFARQQRLPSVHGPRQFADAGGLISYGVNLAALYRRAADYVQQILNGARPADLPIERPPKYDLVVNLITARTLGLAIPPSLLLRADQVIE